MAWTPLCVLLLIAACATREHRPRPTTIKSCAEIAKDIHFRDQFYRNLRGKAWADSPGLKVDLELAVSTPGLIRAEMTAALGVRVGLLVANPDWIQLYIPREKTVFRFPSDEAEKDTLRRERFFRLLPLRVQPSLAVEALLTRVSLPEGVVPACEYEDSKAAYKLKFKKDEGGRIVWVDATTFAPLEIHHFIRGLPADAAGESRPDWKVVFSALTGSGLSTLPTRIEFFSASGRQLLFEWASMEAVPQMDVNIFDWTPPAALSIRDY